MRTWKRASYTRIGVIYMLATLPALVMLVLGKLGEVRNPYLLLSLGGLPLGLLFVLVGLGRTRQNERTEIAVRIALIALTFVVCALLSVIGVKAGIEPLETSVLFSCMAASYISVITLGFMIAGLFKKDAPAPRVVKKESSDES